MELDIPQLVGTIGLPGALCFYVLAFVRKSLDANTAAINALAVQMGGKKDENR